MKSMKKLKDQIAFGGQNFFKNNFKFWLPFSSFYIIDLIQLALTFGLKWGGVNYFWTMSQLGLSGMCFNLFLFFFF